MTVPSQAHEIFCLTNVQAIPLTRDLADKALLSIRRSAPAHASPSSDVTPAPEGSDLEHAAREGGDGAHGVRWGEVVTPGKETPQDSSSESGDEDGESDATGSINSTKTPEKKQKNRITLNPFFKWNPFVPKIKPVLAPVPMSSTAMANTDPFALPTVLPTPTDDSSSTPPLPLLPSALTHPIPIEPAAEDPSLASTAGADPTPPTAAATTRSHLEQKILTSLLALFTSGQMFFSYTHDITNSMAAKSQKGNVDMLPLWRRVDRRFWWNEWLGRELIDAGVSRSGEIMVCVLEN